MRGQNAVIIVVVLVVAGVLGVAIAGLPEPAPDAGIEISAEGGSTTSTAPAGRAGRAGASTTTTTTTTAALRDRRDVRFLAVNGSGRTGAAAELTDRFEELGYSVLTPAGSGEREETVVHHAAGFEREARAVAGLLTVDPGEVEVEPMPDPPPVPQATGADVVVVVGRDFRTGPAVP